MNPRSGGGKVARFGLKDEAEALEALVAGIAAERDLPFLVISAGTRNHFNEYREPIFADPDH